MKGFKKFKRALINPVSAVAMQDVRSSKPAVNAWLTSVIRGREHEDRPKPRELGRDASFLEKLYLAFSEIDASRETLELIAKLARRAPAVHLRVEADAHLRFFVEAYLNEINILSLRCGVLVTVLQRAYRNDARGPHVTRTTTALRQGLSASFKSILEARGAHVHECRSHGSEKTPFVPLDARKFSG